MIDVLVIGTVALVFIFFGLSFLYMVIQDMGIQNECEGYINLIDGFFGFLKQKIKPLTKLYGYENKKHQTNNTRYNGNGNTNPLKLVSKRLKKVQHHEHTDYCPAKISQANQEGSSLPKFDNTKNEQNRECRKQKQLHHNWGYEQKGNKNNTNQNQNITQLFLTHIQLTSKFSFVKRIVSRIKRRCNQKQIKP